MVNLDWTKKVYPVIFFAMDQIVESLDDITYNPDDIYSKPHTDIDTQLLTYRPEVFNCLFFLLHPPIFPV